MEPEQRVADFIKAGSDIVSVHAEQSATIHLHRLVNNVSFKSAAWHCHRLKGETFCQLQHAAAMSNNPSSQAS